MTAAQLACPRCRGDVVVRGDDVACPACGRVGERREGVWDFVMDDLGYAANFGRQWSAFRRTQLDSASGTTISADRFAAITGWTSDLLVDNEVLDAGCGAGRFTEVAVRLGARVTSLDLSSAAYATRVNLKDAGVTVVRGDLLRPPLRTASFDKVFSIGVLQHTPDPMAAARKLVELLVPGGELAIWMYERHWYGALMPKALLRKLAADLEPVRIESLILRLVKVTTPVARAIGHLPNRPRRVLRSMLPIASYWNELPLSPDQQEEWSLLDTHDWISPAFDSPQRFAELRDVLLAAGVSDVERQPVPGLALRAWKSGA